MINKKAQMTWEQLGGIALIVLTVVLIAMGVSGAFDSIFSKMGLLPDNAATYATLCSSYKALPNAYCSYGEFKEVRLSGEKQMVNCEYLADVGFVFDKMTERCNSIATVAKSTCINNKLKPTYKINGQPCSYWNSSAAATVITAVAGTCANKATNPCTGLDVKVCAPADAVCTWNRNIVAEDATMACQLNEVSDVNGKIGCAKLTEATCKSTTYSSLCDWKA